MKNLEQKPNKSHLWLLVFFALLWAVISPESAFADRYKTPENSTPQEVADGMGTKLVRGVANFATGWIEFPKQIYYKTRDDGWAEGLTVGPLKGIFMTVVRTGVGAIEVLTFPVPYPGFYEPFFDPKYVWEKE